MGKAKKYRPSLTKHKNFELVIRDEAEQKGTTKTTREFKDDSFVDSKLSEKILSEVRNQQNELESELLGNECTSKCTVNLGEDLDDLPDEAEADEFYEIEEIDEKDEKALELFMNKNPVPRINLSELILEKITDKQTELQSHLSEFEGPKHLELNPKVESLYKGVGEVLKRYRSGKVPKAAKIIPSLKNWERIVAITDPHNWTAASMYVITKSFVSQANPQMLQRYLNLILFPRVRDDIAEYKKLNLHIYKALERSVYKPASFMKGIVIPLCESGTCSLREAVIISSVILRCRLPMLHSAAAILKLAEMTYSGANSIFIRNLLRKGYALPYRVVDALVFHFLRFQTDPRPLPILWHQSFLSFVERYKADISSEQKEALIQLIKVKGHHLIGPVIQRELEHAKCRDVEEEPQDMS